MTTKAYILLAIRAKCMDCSCHQPGEIRKCPITTCGLWPYRFGEDPEPSRTRGFARSPVHPGGLDEEGQGAGIRAIPSVVDT